MPQPETILRIAIPTPLRRLFDYLPAHEGHVAQVGARVRVNFARRDVIGVVMELTQQSEVPAHKLKRVREVLDAAPVLEPAILQLSRWAAQYYQHPPGEVMQQALPALLRQGRAAETQSQRHYSLSASGAALDLDALKHSPRQQAILARLRSSGGALSDADLVLHFTDHSYRAPLRKLIDKGLVAEQQQALSLEHNPAPLAGPELNTEQQQAVAAVVASLGQSQCFLLDGVTGSGKTEVYLNIIEQVHARGQQVLVLVPEIGLTPQLVDRFRQRLARPVVVLHSALNDQERLNAWLAARSGEAAVVIGTRSAIFTPLHDAGLIIVDEEHDTSLKQQDGFRYHARDLAILRARERGVPVLLGSATPSLESLYNVQQGRSRALHLTRRAGDAQPPRLHAIDLKGQPIQNNISLRLRQAMSEHLQRGQQVMLFLNRRGFAPVLMCHDCGWHARCPRCDAHMTLHRSIEKLRCHHCGSEQRLMPHCPSCKAEALVEVGHGTERLEESLGEMFPDDRILRIDRDSTRRKGELQDKLEQIQRGAAQILIGTQMLAKGHHFPNVTLVGILDADSGLFSADFRATERMAQLIVQVAGRAGRAELPGEVFIQTHHPEHPLLRTLMTAGYAAFAAAAMQERQQTELPPYSYLVLLRAEAVQNGAALSFLQQARQRMAPHAHAGVEFYGPFPAAMERRAGKYRAQLLLQATQRAPLQQLLATCLPLLESQPQTRKVRWSVDVDPMEMF
ncbi:MAG: primosomal protein N' [Gammaproteobacteria bacterium]